MQFAADDRIAPSGTPVHWTKPPLPSAVAHREALSVAVNLSGTRYIARSPVWTPNFAMQFILGGSDLTSLPAPYTVFLRGNNTISTPAGRGLNISFSTATGLFTGTFILPGGAAARVFRGAILQPDMRGAGFFRGRVKSGSVSFEQPSILGGGSGGVIIITR